jgi:DNA polymerase III sliding clamp (beta) subunit (PCNA family)
MPDTAKVAKISVDGDKLAESLRRVIPFVAEGSPVPLTGVYAESDSSMLQLTATDGFRMAHLTVALAFPAGNWLLDPKGVKDFAQRHYNGAAVAIEVGPPAVEIRPEITPTYLKMGDVEVQLLTEEFPDYPSIVPDEFPTEVIIDPKAWIKVLRARKAEIAGVVFSSKGCKVYSQSFEGETIGCDSLPVQVFTGPDVKVAYKAEHLRRGLTSCGATCTFQVSSTKSPSLLEAEDYWHLLMPKEGFPREQSLGQNEREALQLMEDSIKAVKAGEVVGRVLIGTGKFYLELLPDGVATEVLVQEPTLVEAVKTPVIDDKTAEPKEASN